MELSVHFAQHPTCCILPVDIMAFPAPLETISLSGLIDNSVESLRGLVWS